MSAWQWQMGLMGQRAQSALRGTPRLLLNINILTACCQLMYCSQNFVIFICLVVFVFFFLLTQPTHGRSQPEHCSWMDVECSHGKGEWGRAWIEQQEWLGAWGTRYLVIAGCLAYREGRPGDSFEVAGCCRGKEIPTSGRIKRCNLEQQQEIIKLHTRKRILLEGVGTCGRPCAA